MSDLNLLTQAGTSLYKQAHAQRHVADDLKVNVVHVPASPLGFSFNEKNRVLLGGTGTGLSFEEASLPALAEAVERHCSTSFLPEQVLWASAVELGGKAVDLAQFPQCSASELSSAKCLIRPADNMAPIRWVPGLSLQNGEELYLPLSSVYIATPVCEAERFVLPISTGCAAHTSYEAALLSAILEVCERDALSLAWLQQLPLPQIAITNPEDKLGPLWSLLQSSSERIHYAFFNATTDLGVPTILGVRTSEYSKRLHTIVACASSLDVISAIKKVLLELASFAVWLRKKRSIPADIQDFDQMHHGPVYMGHVKRARSFDFLKHNGRSERFEDCWAQVPGRCLTSPHEALKYLLALLAERRIRAYAVDLSTDEAVRAGLFVIRAVLPQLMPFSWVYRSRFLAHPRLYNAPAAMGYTSRPEQDVNIWPCPFG